MDEFVDEPKIKIEELDTYPKMPEAPYKPLPKQEIEVRPMPKEKLEEAKKIVNEDPRMKVNGVVAIQKSTLIWLSIGLILAILVITGLGVWFNMSFSKLTDKNFAPIVNNEINPVVNNTVDVEVKFNQTNNIQVQGGNYTLNLPKELSEALIKVLNKTNSS